MDDKEKIQRFISGFLVAYRDQIDFDEPKSLEETIRNLKHCHDQSKCKTDSNKDWKGNENNKGKWAKKRGKPHDTDGKENVVMYEKFNSADRGHGF